MGRIAEPLQVSRAKLEAIWRADMKQLGREVVRKRYAERMPVTDRMPYPEAAFVQRWLDRQDLKAKIGAALIGILTLGFAAIAAWPVIKDWIGR
jgi:hypothetical protein